MASRPSWNGAALLARGPIAQLRGGLSQELWLVQAGIFVNTLGWGAVLPFEVIYLHDGRGFNLSTAGLVVGALTGLAVVSAPLSGPLIDRFGARACTAGAGVALASGYAWLAFVKSPPLAFAAAAVAGLGNGALHPSQSTLLAALAPPELRHRAIAISRVAINAGFGIGGAVGGLVAAYGLNGFVTLFLVNALSYLVYAGVLLLIVPEQVPPERPAGGYSTVIRDRALLHLAATNVAIMAVGWGALPWLVPPFARSQLGVGASLIGLVMLVNAATVVLAQLPIAKLAEGRPRVLVMACGAILMAGAFLLIAAAQLPASGSFAMVLVAAVAIGVGECCHTSALVPLTAELAPANLRGRYMATLGLSTWVGLALAPTLGTALLSISATATFSACAAAAAAAAVSLLALERHLPASSRLTPQPARRSLVPAHLVRGDGGAAVKAMNQP